MAGDTGEGDLREALKAVAVALKGARVRFALGGGYAAWARGGPEPDHDVDFLLDAADVASAEEALTDAGLTVEHPPEDWLFKVFRDGAMVDVIHHLHGSPVDGETLRDAQDVEVESVVMPVITATEVLVDKLRALDEHACDLSSLLPVARALREQVDWPAVRRRTAGNDFAVAALVLLELLGIVALESEHYGDPHDERAADAGGRGAAPSPRHGGR